jgi:hypothetical protein
MMGLLMYYESTTREAKGMSKRKSISLVLELCEAKHQKWRKNEKDANDANDLGYADLCK